MKNIFLILCSTLIVGCMATSNKKIEELSCSEDIGTIKVEIKNTYKADSVVIFVKKIKEEIYFPEIHSPVVLIYNATTDVLDFKKLPTDYYQGFESSLAIERQLKEEALPIARNLIEKCDMSEFNDLIIEFLKLNDEGKPIYRFICHYNDLLIRALLP